MVFGECQVVIAGLTAGELGGLRAGKEDAGDGVDGDEHGDDADAAEVGLKHPGSDAETKRGRWSLSF